MNKHERLFRDYLKTVIRKNIHRIVQARGRNDFWINDTHWEIQGKYINRSIPAFGRPGQMDYEPPTEDCHIEGVIRVGDNEYSFVYNNGFITL